jgi:hypothetical protein
MSSGPSTSRRTEADPLSSRYSINSVPRILLASLDVSPTLLARADEVIE